MLLCPVDLDVCDRAACRRGVCERSEMTVSAPLFPCWECGTVAEGWLTIGVCDACIPGHGPAAPIKVN